MHSVSVVIPTYNQSRFLGAAIDAALAQSAPALEVIVVDDGSTDDTVQLLKTYGAKIRSVRQGNLGVAAARNNGARIARGRLLAFLDSDDFWLPQKLSRQLKKFEQDPDLGLVHCGLEFIDEQGLVIGIETRGLEGDVATQMLLLREPVILGGGSGALIRKDIFEEVGGFDRRLSTSADWDLYYRIASRSRVGFVSDVLLKYRLHASNMHRNIQAMEHDMLSAFAKSFQEADPSRARLKRQCYGNLHAVLAGSFYAAGEYKNFIIHAAKGVVMNPGNLARFLEYPVRLYRNRGRGHACAAMAERGIA